MGEVLGVRKPLCEAIYRAYEREAGSSSREHLGASIIGKLCERALWYDFCWASPITHPGRVLRLLESGQREESRLARDLRRLGATVLEVDPETGRQFRVSALGGHFAGSLDGLAWGVPDDPARWQVLEFKTHNAKSFAELLSQGVRRAKPLHFAQVQIYMALMELEVALYMAVCKDDDALYIERIALDPHIAAGLIAKAERIIGAQSAPARISDDPAHYGCRYCEHAALCHGKAAARVHCRSCLHASPVTDGWHCTRHEAMLKVAQQREGCADHLYLSSLVPGEQIDASPETPVQWVHYRFADGSTWRDGLCDKRSAPSVQEYTP